MCIIVHGTHNLLNICGGDTSQVILNDINYIAEVSLFVRLTHVSTLVCVTTAEDFTLSGYDLAESVRESPSCSSLVYEYATIFLARLRNGMLVVDVCIPIFEYRSLPSHSARWSV